MSAVLLNKEHLKHRLRQFLDEDLTEVRNILQRQFRNPGMFIQDVASHVSRFQGKQIRPILTLLTAHVFQAPVSGRMTARTLAAVVELIHTATLVHDDVIDDSSLRRHVATVHRRWNTETSVLFGDYLLSKSFHLAATTGDAGACALIGRATDRTCEGELNQIAARLEQSCRESDYFRIINGKTAQLFGLSCQLGARAAGASANDQRRMRLFGRRLGMAFQIADDILDLTATSGQTGKDAENDLQNQRMTLPLLRGRASRAESRENTPGLTGDQLQAGIQSARCTAGKLLDRAMRVLQTIPQGEPAELLAAVARAAI